MDFVDSDNFTVRCTKNYFFNMQGYMLVSERISLWNGDYWEYSSNTLLYWHLSKNTSSEFILVFKTWVVFFIFRTFDSYVNVISMSFFLDFCISNWRRPEVLFGLVLRAELQHGQCILSYFIKISHVEHRLWPTS